MKESIKDGDKVLVVGKMDEVKNLESHLYNEFPFAKIDFLYFQRLRGKNDWRGYNKCFIIHTPNINFIYYFFIYELYHNYFVPGKQNTKLIYNNDLEVKKLSKNWGYTNPVIEKIRKTYLASIIYQSVMRINRDKDLSADIYIFNSDNDILEMINAQFESADPRRRPVILFDDPIEPSKSRNNYNCTKRRSDDYTTNLIEKFLNLDFGEYDKTFLKNDIDCNSKQYFSKVLNSAFKRFKEKGCTSIQCENPNEESIIMYDRIVTKAFQKIIITPLK